VGGEVHPALCGRAGRGPGPNMSRSH